MNYLHNRFQKEADKMIQDYVTSIHFDQRLYRQDIEGSIAHARMLAKQGIISEKEAELIVMGLVSIREEIGNRGKYRQAEKELDKALKLAPDWPWLYHNLCRLGG